MAPEHDARTRAFYDHESDEQSPRRRRAAVDWGVNEDIFDRMPSRRFKRSDRRAEHHDDLDPRRFERRVSGPAEPRHADEWDERRSRRDDWADEHERRQIAPRSGDWPAPAEPSRTPERADVTPRDGAAPRSARDGAAPRAARDGAAPRSAARAGAAPRSAPRDEYAEAASRFAAEYDDEAPAPAPARRPGRRPAESWTDDIPAIPADEGKRPVDSWLEPDPGKELELAPGESRTIVLETMPEVSEPVVEDASGRRTVTITGHPDRMPVARTQRPPRSAVERIGASPDRIVGYAVLLGFVLVLIAVLTTGQ
jgi:hypothetical protein